MEVLAVLKTMTDDYAAYDTPAQEFGASFMARDVAFLRSGSILQGILIHTIVGRVLSDARVVRVLLSPRGETY